MLAGASKSVAQRAVRAQLAAVEDAINEGLTNLQKRGIPGAEAPVKGMGGHWRRMQWMDADKMWKACGQCVWGGEEGDFKGFL